MKTNIHNALSDFTEQDQAKRNYIMLQENRFRQQCEPKQEKQIKWKLFLAFCILTAIYFIAK